MKTKSKMILLFLFVLSISGLMAQGDKSYDENTKIVNAGVGLGRNYYSPSSVLFGTSNYVNTPVFSVSYEQAFKKKLGPGYLGVGGYVAYQHSSYRSEYSLYYYQSDWNYIMPAARAVYHWDVLNFKKADIYAGVLVGVRIQTYAYTSNDTDPYATSYYQRNDGSVYPAYSFFAGARYYFVPSFGVYAEVGYGISYVTGGVSLKF